MSSNVTGITFSAQEMADLIPVIIMLIIVMSIMLTIFKVLASGIFSSSSEGEPRIYTTKGEDVEEQEEEPILLEQVECRYCSQIYDADRCPNCNAPRTWYNIKAKKASPIVAEKE